MKLIRVLTHKAAREGEEIPWGWGVVYYDASSRDLILAPMPFNFVAGWLRLVYFRLMEGPRDRLFAEWDRTARKEYSRQYDYGFKDGEKAAKVAVGKALKKFLEGKVTVDA